MSGWAGIEGVAGTEGVGASGGMTTDGAGAEVGAAGALLPARPKANRPIATPDAMASNSMSK
jgi:hypothetical protein